MRGPNTAMEYGNEGATEPVTPNDDDIAQHQLRHHKQTRKRKTTN